MSSDDQDKKSVEPGRTWKDVFPHLQAEIHILVLFDKNLIVFLDENLDVDWETNDDYEKDGYEDEEKHNAILNTAATLECTPHSHQNKNIIINFKRMIAEGIARSLKHDYVNAEKILADAKIYIECRNIEKARYWQLLTTMTIGTISAITIVPIAIFKNEICALLGVSVLSIALGGVCGAIGSTVSIILRLGKANITSESEKRLHVVEVVAKNFAGVASGSLTATLIKFNILFTLFSGQSILLAASAGGLIAGASERFVPSIISMIESKTIQKKEGD